MSDYRAIAAATQTLQNLLLEAIREAVPGATVKTGPPEVRPPEEVGEGLINIFLFKVENLELGARVEGPAVVAGDTTTILLDVGDVLSCDEEDSFLIEVVPAGAAATPAGSGAEVAS